jgi:ABC-2 type transport system ATP-binding protein
MIGQLAADGKTILVSSHILSELAEMCDIVGIIEQGKLLVVGSVDDIQRGMREQQQDDVEQQNIVSVRVLSDSRSLANWLNQRDRVQEVRVDGQSVMFAHPAGAEAEADLLRDMIQAGFRVVQFGSQRRSLEDVFLQVTEGKVQ